MKTRDSSILWHFFPFCFCYQYWKTDLWQPYYCFAGLRKVTDDMKTKNRSDRSGVVSSSTAAPAAAPEKTSRAGSFSFKSGPPKLELQMGRKWASPWLLNKTPNRLLSKTLVYTVNWYSMGLIDGLHGCMNTNQVQQWGLSGKPRFWLARLH